MKPRPMSTCRTLTLLGHVLETSQTYIKFYGIFSLLDTFLADFPHFNHFFHAHYTLR